MSQSTHLPFLHPEQASVNLHIQDVALSTNMSASVEVMLIQAQTWPSCVKKPESHCWPVMRKALMDRPVLIKKQHIK